MSFFFFKQKTAYEMRISDWSSDVCSSDLVADRRRAGDDPRADENVAFLQGGHVECLLPIGEVPGPHRAFGPLRKHPGAIQGHDPSPNRPPAPAHRTSRGAAPKASPCPPSTPPAPPPIRSTPPPPTHARP